jgi:MazG family protein
MEQKERGGKEFGALFEVANELRTRCPWDREQTRESLAKHMIEEAYEASDAIERGDASGLQDELGDLLSQVLFQTVIAEEQGLFTIESLLDNARMKLIRRHPHVYADVKVADSADVVRNWETIKEQERGKAGFESAVDGIARTLPALIQAEKLGERAKSAGMDWADIHAVLGTVEEELRETERALGDTNDEHAADELGDMLLALANAPRFLNRSAEQTLRKACDKFADRFREMEKLAASRQLDLKRLTPDQIDSLWHEAKSGEKAKHG